MHHILTDADLEPLDVPVNWCAWLDSWDESSLWDAQFQPADPAQRAWDFPFTQATADSYEA